MIHNDTVENINSTIRLSANDTSHYIVVDNPTALYFIVQLSQTTGFTRRSK